MEIGLLSRQGARDHAEIGEALAGVVDTAARSTGLDIDLDPGSQRLEMLPELRGERGDARPSPNTKRGKPSPPVRFRLMLALSVT